MAAFLPNFVKALFNEYFYEFPGFYYGESTHIKETLGMEILLMLTIRGLEADSKSILAL